MNVAAPAVICVIGLPGAGKTRWADQFAARRRGVFRYDPNTELAELGFDRDDIVARDIIETEILTDLPDTLSAGLIAIVEFGCWIPEQREAVRQAAAGPDVTTHLVWLRASAETLLERIRQRGQPGDDRITIEQLQAWTAVFEPPGPLEIIRWNSYTILG